MASPNLNLSALVSRLAGDLPSELRQAAVFADHHSLSVENVTTLAPILAALVTAQAGAAVTNPTQFQGAIVDLLVAAAEIVSVVQR